MARIKLHFPDKVIFSTQIPVRITDINYGGHAGNDTILSIIHEARMQFLKSHNFSEMNFGGLGMIMSDVVIEYKAEVFYGDIIEAQLAIGETSKASFELYYKLLKKNGETVAIAAIAKTGMVSFDYSKKKVAAIPDEALKCLSL